MAVEREQVEEALPGDIIGLHNHGTIQIGDTFTEGEDLNYTASRTSPRNCSAASRCGPAAHEGPAQGRAATLPRRAPPRSSGR